MDSVGIIALILSGISIVVAVVALIKSQRTQNQMLRIEQAREHDRQVEKRRAKITAKLEHLQKHGRYELIIANSGASEARDVKVTLNEKPLSELNSIQPKVPRCLTIGAGSSFSCHWKTNETPNILAKLKITWSDDSGKPGFYHTTLSHPTTPKEPS